MTYRFAIAFWLVLLASPLLGAQFAYPTADNTDGGWSVTGGTACTATDCTTEIDEGEDTPATSGTESQADYVYSKTMSTVDSDTYEASVTSLSEPATTTGSLRYSNYKVETGGGAAAVCNSIAYVYEGATLRHTCPTLAAAKNSWSGQTCSPVLSAVTDWTTLEVRIVANRTGGGKNCSVRISWIELEVPDAASGADQMMIIGE